ncbi:MAG: lipocalin family protein [Methylophaga sp.]
MLRYGLFSVVLMFMLAGCSASQPPIRTESSVDLAEFMGDWYVIANIPTFIEKGAHNSFESYEMNDDGTIATTFRFRKNGFDGEEKTYHPKGYVKEDGSNAIWGMQFIWPIKADYRIVYLNDDYTQTIIGRQQRDYVWIMARTPNISDRDYADLLEMLENEGYDISQIQKVPQQWPEK